MLFLQEYTWRRHVLPELRASPSISRSIYLTPKQDDFNQELRVCIAEALYCITLLRLNNIQIKPVQHVGKLIDSKI